MNYAKELLCAITIHYIFRKIDEYWNLEFTDEFIRRKEFAIYPKHDTEIYHEHT